MKTLLALAAGGLAGTFARYFLAGAVQHASGAQFPFGTLAVNLTGCFLAGFLPVLADERFHLGLPGRILLITGFCGAFTTFSALMIESDQLLRHGSFLKAFTNIFVSVAAGLLLFRAGVFLAEKLVLR